LSGIEKGYKKSMILNNHKRIMVVSDGIIHRDGKIECENESNIHINSFRYDIHDFFNDIRGTTR
jgi:hypothetical protein